MPLYKFGVGDVFYNQIKAHPSSSFFIYDRKIYYQNASTLTASNTPNTGHVPVGHVSLFELNLDRPADTSGTRYIGTSTGTDGILNTGKIYPWIYKGLNKYAFKNTTRKQYIHFYDRGDVMTGSYPMSASIVRALYQGSTHKDGTRGFFTGSHTGSALRNLLNHASILGTHYDLTSSAHKSDVDINIIDIPSIFYGSEIKKGSVSLKYYVTGTLTAELKDNRYDGALIQHSGADDQGAAYDGEIAGVVLYKQGFIILTGSWDLCSLQGDVAGDAAGSLSDRDYAGAAVSGKPRWVRFAYGANDELANVTYGAAGTAHNNSSSFALDFVGTQKIPTITMLAHANKGELNYSNNPTYIKHTVNTASYNAITASYFYGEADLSIKNIHSSSYADPSGSLKKTTYITKVGIYDDKKKLIGIASVAKPVKKTEERDLTFKLKLDI